MAGQLTDAPYRAKLAEMRAAVAAGELAQAQLERYDAELGTCLKWIGRSSSSVRHHGRVERSPDVRVC